MLLCFNINFLSALWLTQLKNMGSFYCYIGKSNCSETLGQSRMSIIMFFMLIDIQNRKITKYLIALNHCAPSQTANTQEFNWSGVWITQGGLFSPKCLWIISWDLRKTLMTCMCFCVDSCSHLGFLLGGDAFSKFYALTLSNRYIFHPL